MKKSFAVVGGGILGMMVAYRLSQEKYNVILFEAGNRLGGLTSPWELNGITWDKFYHVISSSDHHLLSLLKELNLEKEISWVETKTGFFTEGRLYSMSNTLEFLKFPPLSFFDKIRLGLTIFIAARIKNWKKLERISVESWLVKWSGKKTFRKIWLPLLRSKLGENYQETSAAFIWATIQRMYNARHSSHKKEMFGYVNGGYSRILNRFTTLLNEKKVEMKIGFTVKKVEIVKNKKLKIFFENQKEMIVDAVVLTIPSPMVSNISTNLSNEEKNRLDITKYLGVICASILIKKPLSDYYVTNITDDGFPFTGVIEMSALVDKKYFGGHSLVYLPKYLAADDPMFSLSDEKIKNDFLVSLGKIHPKLNTSDIICFKVARAKFVFALSTLNYSENLPPVRTSVPGVFILNSAHIVNGTLNVNETIGLVHNKLDEIINNSNR